MQPWLADMCHNTIPASALPSRRMSVQTSLQTSRRPRKSIWPLIDHLQPVFELSNISGKLCGFAGLSSISGKLCGFVGRPIRIMRFDFRLVFWGNWQILTDFGPSCFFFLHFVVFCFLEPNHLRHCVRKTRNQQSVCPGLFMKAVRWWVPHSWNFYGKYEWWLQSYGLSLTW